MLWIMKPPVMPPATIPRTCPASPARTPGARASWSLAGSAGRPKRDHQNQHQIARPRGRTRPGCSDTGCAGADRRSLQHVDVTVSRTDTHNGACPRSTGHPAPAARGRNGRRSWPGSVPWRPGRRAARLRYCYGPRTCRSSTMVTARQAATPSVREVCTPRTRSPPSLPPIHRETPCHDDPVGNRDDHQDNRKRRIDNDLGCSIIASAKGAANSLKIGIQAR